MIFNYQKYQFIISISFLFCFIFCLAVSFCIKKTYQTYSVLNSVVRYDNSVQLMINSKDLKQLNRNSYVYIQNKKKKYEIVEVVRNVLKRDNIHYHHVMLKVTLDKKAKINDSIDLVLYKESKSILSLLCSFFKED